MNHSTAHLLTCPPPSSAQAFLCSALVFCALVQVAFWRFHSPSQVEDAVLDTYDLVYDQAVKGSDGIWRQELVAIQDTIIQKPVDLSGLALGAASHALTVDRLMPAVRQYLWTFLIVLL
ncbi:hypothetical protein CB1_000234001 [Camelus ferus]|nr:hypothetical protein CB1_000234001 [Camelus ferus]